VTLPVGVPAPATSILCSAWADATDIPTPHRAVLTDAQWGQVILYASEILYHLSGSRWLGEGCTGTVTLRSKPAALGTGSWPYLSWGTCGCWVYTNTGWGYQPGYVGTHPRPMAINIDADTRTITGVTADGVIMDPGRYRLSKSGWLERIDGGGWSLCGPEAPTVVAYTRGIAPPMSGVTATVQYAVELMKAWTGDSTCVIPTSATQVTRQGVSVTLNRASRQSDNTLKTAGTGVPWVDQWIAAVNPKGRARSGSVWSPDIPAGSYS
jgi:hypothetical protein